MKTQMINHVALVIDDSGSMRRLVQKTREVVTAQLKGFETTSRNKGQETRVSVYTFGDTSKCVVFDENPAVNIGPSSIPPTRTYINATSGNTALIDAIFETIRDLQTVTTKTGDHSFLIYVITDGFENASTRSAAHLKKLIEGLNGDWTVAAMVPNTTGKHYARTYGIPEGNIEIWETTEKGMEEVGVDLGSTYASYSTARSVGVKKSTNLFGFKKTLTKKEVEKELEEIDPGTYETLLVRKYDDGKGIKEFVETWRKLPYRVGSAYYQLTKPEKIQGSKSIAVLQKSTGKLYSGSDARDFLGLPDHEVKVQPADYVNFDIFVQSTSTNRHLVADTQLIVFK